MGKLREPRHLSVGSESARRGRTLIGIIHRGTRLGVIAWTEVRSRTMEKCRRQFRNRIGANLSWSGQRREIELKAGDLTVRVLLNIEPSVVPPKSRVVLRSHPELPTLHRKEVGREFRVGYYSPEDGLDCVWLVNAAGEYEQSVDRAYLAKFFEIKRLGKERDYYGEHRAELRPLRGTVNGRGRTVEKARVGNGARHVAHRKAS
jgi:hypothetical protein